MSESSYTLNLVSLLEFTTVVSTVIQFLSGTVVCRNYIQKKSTGDTSGFPFICGFLSCSFWLRYGILTDEDTLTLVNTVGATLFLIYCVIYFTFTVNKQTYIKQILLTLLILLGVIFYTNSFEDHEDVVHKMGIISCIVTVLFFAAPLTMLFHVIRVKNSESLPFPLIAMGFIVSVQWVIYGVIVEDTFIQIPNFLGCVLSLLQLFLFVCYPPKSFIGQGYKMVDQNAC